MKRAARLALGLAALATLGATPAKDPANPTCPLHPNWSTNPTMVLTPVERSGVKVLLAEGRVDAGLPDRLKATLAAHPDITEIWLSSPGGDARAGNAAGRVIRSNMGITTRIPSGARSEASARHPARGSARWCSTPEHSMKSKRSSIPGRPRISACA